MFSEQEIDKKEIFQAVRSDCGRRLDIVFDKLYRDEQKNYAESFIQDASSFNFPMTDVARAFFLVFDKLDDDTIADIVRTFSQLNGK